VEGGAEAPAGIDLEAVAGHIVDNFTDSALRRGLFHADLHPANLLLVPPAEAPTGSTDSTDSADSTDSTDSTDSAGAVGYVDFGIAGTLSRHSRRNLLAMILAMYQGDATGFERAFLKIAILRPGTDLEAFGRGIDRLLTEWSEDPDEGAAATAATGRKHHRLHCRFTRIMLDLLFLSRSTNLWPAPEVLRYFRSAISTDGLIQRFAPGFDVGARFHQQCRRLLTEEAVRHPFSAATVADWSAAGMRQLTQVLQPPPLTDGQPLKETGSKSRSLRRRTCRLLLLLTGCTLAAALHPAPRWGLNLFSAELTVAGVASLALVTTLYRLARGIG
jgi:predicted unusual protein kinase regulating ubiquinone biosynthesis (AarF/ABC1/UbiB family)